MAHRRIDTATSPTLCSMITDVQLSALANWLGSLTMILIVIYHVSSTRWAWSSREKGLEWREGEDQMMLHFIASYPWLSPVMDVPIIYLWQNALNQAGRICARATESL